MPTNLTESYVSKLKFKDKPFLVRDTKLAGFMVAVNKASKSYKVQRDLWVGKKGKRKNAKTVRYTLGTTKELKLEDARIKAAEIITLIKKGIDPHHQQSDEPQERTVAKLYDDYEEDLRIRECADRTISSMRQRLERYIPNWKPKLITEITKEFASQEHKRITKEFGPVVANKAIQDFGTCYRWAVKFWNSGDKLPDNPVGGVRYNKVRERNKSVLPEDLPEWWRKIDEISNPLRRDMHKLGLLSGLRPGTLVSLQKDWVKLKDKAISIPKMKSGRSFDLPLSKYMVGLVKDILTASQVLYPNSPWLFPTRSTKTKEIIATQVWKEKELPSETGHILRHTHRTTAQSLEINEINGRLLLDHAVEGISGVYIHKAALFKELLADQEKITKKFLKLAKINGGRKVLPRSKK